MTNTPSITWLQRCLIATIAVEVLALGSSALQLNLLSNAPVEMEAAEANDRREAMVGGIFLLVYLFTVVVFARWIIAAHKRVRVLGARDMTISPGWAVGYYFIPFINLVRPYTAMKELLRASMSPEHAASQITPAILPCWWALWIINNIMGQIALRMSMNADTLQMLQAVTVVNMTASFLGVLLSVVALKLVKRITANLNQLTEPPSLPAN